MKSIAFFDLEVNPRGGQIVDIGCLLSNGATFHENSLQKFIVFVKDAQFFCGHNVVLHDIPIIRAALGNSSFAYDKTIDTLFLSPLLFPNHPYHKLVKEEKLDYDDPNNPLIDSIKAQELFEHEVAAFRKLDSALQVILYNLLANKDGFTAFFDYLDYSNLVSEIELEALIGNRFSGKICSGAPVDRFIREKPVALAYALTLINVSDQYSVTPAWVRIMFPNVEYMIFQLRNKPCLAGCNYCKESLDGKKALKRYFNHDDFRSYAGEPLQEKAVLAAIQGKSLLTVFPTGGGKSITFQVPALIAAENAKALTVVISPLQSLMKDQVDNLEKNQITEAGTINGLLNPIERQEMLQRVSGDHPERKVANILYISPESLRSATIERLLRSRKIARFVIDEAHCFSSWGQDFRVDYLYIAPFIKQLQKDKGLEESIPVSCFTATAKQKVIEDICAYFKEHLDLELEVFRSNARRTNLHFQVYREDDEDRKYSEARRLIEVKSCPTIIYVSRTKKADKLAEHLCQDGYRALAYHGKMEPEEKTKNQNEFISGRVDIMVATSAFGMGVDKNDVGLVIHYEISDSLENYVQESGRAGRNEKIKADCYILFNEDDLDKHFQLLNRNKLGQKEINQIWGAIKRLAKSNGHMCNSALEIARKAGWDDSDDDVSTRVTTAIAALEQARYVERGKNYPRVYASSILSKTAAEAISQIDRSDRFNEEQKTTARRILKKLFSSKSRRLATDEPAESRVDYISDHLAIPKEKVLEIIYLLIDEKILDDAKDLTAFVKKGQNPSRSSLAILEKHRQLEKFLLSRITEVQENANLKELYESAIEAERTEIDPTMVKTVINFWKIRNWVMQRSLDHTKNHISWQLVLPKDKFQEKMERRHLLAREIVQQLHSKAAEISIKADSDEVLIEFSIRDLKEGLGKTTGLFTIMPCNEDIEDALFYLSKIRAIIIEGGFLVLYSGITLKRLISDNRVQYKQADYQGLARFYKSKVQQVHIVGEYAKKMLESHEGALQYVDDYFELNFNSFLKKYFPNERAEQIDLSVTPEKYHRVMGDLALAQKAIIEDYEHNIVVAAGPGSGKTRVLVHKLASLILFQDVKAEQLLMLTFSRAAATEFKKRLLELVGKMAHYVDIKTFHSYCFDLLGRVGSLEDADTILKTAIKKMGDGEIEESKITKTALVIDEAQDMSSNEYALVKALIEKNPDLKVIMVGDDDQNIYSFRGSDSRYLANFIHEHRAKKYQLLINYRSKANIVMMANQWAAKMAYRLKQNFISSATSVDGKIQVVKYKQTSLISPLVDHINTVGLSGTTCVLTRTNQEAQLITGLLIKLGYRAKLIQENDGFKLGALQELCFFTQAISGDEKQAQIDNEEWDDAKIAMEQRFKGSSTLEWCKLIIKDFEAVNRERKYKSDWKTFLEQSKFEDFVQVNGETIYVSTMHKAKGKEFDNVFIMLDNFDASTEDCKRQLYVAMTRAKSNLYIHTNGNYLNDLVANNLTRTYDPQNYDEPPYVSFILTHRDVDLGYFEYVQHRMNGILGGTALKTDSGGLATDRGLVVKFSRPFLTRLQSLIGQGFQVTTSSANYVLYWWDKEKKKEVKIVLPQVALERKEK